MPKRKKSSVQGKGKLSRRERFLSAVSIRSTPKPEKKFYSKGNRVYFLNKGLLFNTDNLRDAPETELLTAHPIEGDSNAMTGREVARLIAEVLNKELVGV